MKYFFFVLVFCSTAWPQTKTGSVAVYFSSQNQIAMAADSRAVFNDKRGHDDTDCKIRAFGSEFFVVITGFASHGKDAFAPSWSGYKDARNAWLTATHLKGGLSARRLVDTVAEEWATAMETENHLKTPAAIDAIRLTEFGGGSVVVSAFFGATDKDGELVAATTDISVDLPLFDKRHEVKLSHVTKDVPLGNMGVLGFPEIVTEFHFQTTDRARKLMSRYLRKISRLTPEAQNAAQAAKLVELSIELHPRKEFLAKPVDELQLVRGKGINWLARKPGCKNQE